MDIFTQQLGHSPSHPPLLLAPMEGVTNPVFREAIIALGGASIVATEFVRITSDRQRVEPFIRHAIPLQIQFMGTNPEYLAGSIEFLKKKDLLFDTDWIDLNVGCPSRRVNSHGAGAKLLEAPLELLEIIKEMRSVHSGILSIKMRIGFRNEADFSKLLGHLATAPIDFVTIHARTKCDGYHEPARWQFLTQAARELPFPVIGNGDVWSASDGVRMLTETGVRGLMCGRGTLRNPWLLHDLRGALDRSPSAPIWQEPSHSVRLPQLLRFTISLINSYESSSESGGNFIGCLKEFLGFLTLNPIVGRPLFDRVKRCRSAAEIRSVLESMVALTEV